MIYKKVKNNGNGTKNIDNRIADPETDEIVSVSLKKSLLFCFEIWGKAVADLKSGALARHPHPPLHVKNPWNKQCDLTQKNFELAISSNKPCLNKLSAVEDPGFPREGAPTYDLPNFPPKLHQIERICYVDPPLLWVSCVWIKRWKSGYAIGWWL